MSDTYWDIINESIVSGDSASWSFTFKVNGVSVDITTWDVYFKATAPWTTDVITILPAAMVKSKSGTGLVTDTVSIPFATGDTDIDPGFYDLQITSERTTGSGNIDTLFKGTLTIATDIEAGI